MKKFLSLLLALCMAFGAVSAWAEALPQETEGALPQVGDVVYGFEAKEIRDFPMIGAVVTLFEHQKTGAKLTYIANDDTNRVFQLTFLTRPIDDTGLPHVFEHSTLSGSEKYPSAALFMNLLYQTYNTYMNAYTTDAMTCYPVASLSEEQLLKYADFYTDSCLHPNILHDESIYRTEAWRYRMASLEDELTLEGTVYSEMQGAYTLARAANMNANKITFPGAAITYDYGGMPDAIPDMTFEALCQYHDTFYHPSNSMAYLYGQFEDYAAFLALLDEAYSAYDKVDFHYEDAAYEPITAPQEAKVAYPTAAGSDPANQTYVFYYIVCPGMKGNVEQENIIDNLMSLLNEDASLMMQNLKKALPAASFSFGREVAAPDDAIVFVAANVNEDDAALFKETVDASLRQVAEAGFPQDMVDSVMASLELSTKLAPETADPVEGILQSFSYDYAVTGDPFRYLDMLDSLFKLDEMNQQGLYQACINDWLLDKETYTLTTTYPAPGMKEAHDAALEEYLAQVKEGMTEEEKQAVIDFTNAENADEDASAMVAQLQAVTVDSLPEEARIYDVSDETDENGIRRIDVTAHVDAIGIASLYLDASALPQEDLHYFRLFTRLLGQLDTNEHTKEELDVLTSRYLYGQTIGIDVTQPEGEDYHPYLIMEWTAADDDLAAGYDLMYELVFHTQFTDAQKLLERVQAQKASVRNTINNSCYSVMLYRGLAVDIPLYRYYNYINYLDYYAFLVELEEALNQNPEEVAQRFEAIQDSLSNRSGAIVGFAGNEESIALNRGLADAFMEKLTRQEAREAVAYDLPIPSQREALIVDGNVQFNNVVASFNDLGLEDFDASLNVITSLVADQILVPVLRDQYGVYTPLNSIVQDGGFYLITYRDPNVAETFQVYESLPEIIGQLEIDQETLDGYILNNYSSLAQGSGELTGAAAVVDTVINGKSQDLVLEYMQELKAVTADRVKEAAQLYQNAWENGVRSTAGSAGAINANADLYEVILNPFNAQDASQVALTDVPEDSEYYSAVRMVFEEGLMAAKTEDTFGVDDEATVGELFAALYYLGFGESTDGAEAVATFNQFGIVPSGADADTVLTNGLSDQIFVGFGSLVGLGLEADDPNETTDQPMTRGQLAQQLELFLSFVQ